MKCFFCPSKSTLKEVESVVVNNGTVIFESEVSVYGSESERQWCMVLESF